jgi:hypothetical protein
MVFLFDRSGSHRSVAEAASVSVGEPFAPCLTYIIAKYFAITSFGDSMFKHVLMMVFDLR